MRKLFELEKSSPKVQAQLERLAEQDGPPNVPSAPQPSNQVPEPDGQGGSDSRLIEGANYLLEEAEAEGLLVEDEVDGGGSDSPDILHKLFQAARACAGEQADLELDTGNDADGGVSVAASDIQEIEGSSSRMEEEKLRDVLGSNGSRSSCARH